MPAKYQTAHGNFEIDGHFRMPLLESNRTSCNPRDIEFYKRSFYLFDDEKGIETPNPVKSVESVDFGPRGGVSTRFLHSRRK